MLLSHSDQRCTPDAQGASQPQSQTPCSRNCWERLKPHQPFVFYCSKIRTIRKVRHLPNIFF